MYETRPAGGQGENEKLLQLEQMAFSDHYAEQFADSIEALGLWKAPANFKSSVIERSRRFDIQAAMGSSLLSKKLALFSYGLKIAAATALSITLIWLTPDIRTGQPSFLPDTPRPLCLEAYDKMQEWNSKIDRIITDLWNVEVSLYDK